MKTYDLRSPDTLEPNYGWRGQARCQGMDPQVFDAETAADERKAQYECRRCPVAAACLADAMNNERGDHITRAGVRGGLTPEQRSQLASPSRRRRKATA